MGSSKRNLSNIIVSVLKYTAKDRPIKVEHPTTIQNFKFAVAVSIWTVSAARGFSIFVKNDQMIRFESFMEGYTLHQEHNST